MNGVSSAARLLDQWYEVDTELRLDPVTAANWGAGSKRMQEECLESVVAMNLDVLFPNERLVLLTTQRPIAPDADILAIDPLGCVRVMELKKERAKPGDLEVQLISYSHHNRGGQEWLHGLAGSLTFLPEWAELAIEGFLCDLRIKAVGCGGRNRFEGARHKVKQARLRRSAAASSTGFDHAGVRSALARLYDATPESVSAGDPLACAREIVTRKWGFVPRSPSTEFVLVAPSLIDNADAGQSYESRGAMFCLIDAELRRTTDGRSFLRWTPVRRTLDPMDVQLLSEFMVGLARRSRKVAETLICRPSPHKAAPAAPKEIRLYWSDDNVRLAVRQNAEKQPVFTTESHWVTEGLADLKDKRKRELEALQGRLSHLQLKKEKGSELSLPWDRDHLASAIEFTLAYHEILDRLGFFVDRYRWHQRPKTG